MFKTCVKAVDCLRKGWGLVSTVNHRLAIKLFTAMDNSQVVRNSSNIDTHRYAQAKTVISPLFEQVLYPVSTTPIIMKTR